MNIQIIFNRLTDSEKRNFFKRVYNILIGLKANNEMKDSFIHYMMGEDTYKEWRFQGILGFGGKYYFPENRVSCYHEDANSGIEELIMETNKMLTELISQYIED